MTKDDFDSLRRELRKLRAEISQSYITVNDIQMSILQMEEQQDYAAKERLERLAIIQLPWWRRWIS